LNSALYIGGAENVTATLCRGLDRERFDVLVAHFKGHGPIAKELEQEGHRVIGLAGAKEGRDWLTSRRLRRVLVEEQIDIVHSHDLHTLIDASLCALTLPTLRHVSTFHFGNYPRRDRRSRWMEGAFLRAPHRAVAVGEVQRHAIAAAYGLPAGRFSVVRNGVGDARARATSDDAARIRGGAEVVIGSVSTLIEQKGLDQLLRAARMLVDQGVRFRLVIAGDGHLRQALEGLCRELGLGAHVEFLGWVQDAAGKVLPWIDIFVQSSLWEAMSMVVLEAMACGCPIVATTVGENPYVVREGVSGFLVSAGEPAPLAERLRRLIEDRALRTSFAGEARKDYETHYTGAQMCAQYESLYLETLL
jgi:glycosyltransferase involved in cell wall biosynthesis